MAEDRNAFTDNKISWGIPEHLTKTVKGSLRGVTRGEIGGVEPASARMRGVTMDERGYVQKNYPQSENVIARKQCRGKEGTCKAYPIKGSDLCVGHTKQLG